MRDDRAHRTCRCAIAALGLLLCAQPARADGIYGRFETQYQKAEENITYLSADGTPRTLSQSRELWLRTLDMHQQSYPRQDLMLETNLRVVDLQWLQRDNMSRTPTGGFRLVHPYAQFMASYQPAWTKASIASQSGLNPDSATTQNVTTHNKETMLSGHLNLPRMPRLDLTLVNRRREGGTTVANRNQTRSGRLTFDRERYSVYGTASQQRLSSEVPGFGTNVQTVLAGGGSYRYVPRPQLSFQAQYDLSDAQSSVANQNRPSVISQSAYLNGDWRPTARWVGMGNYQWRRVDYQSANVPSLADQEGSVMGRYLFTRRASALAGGGFRTVRAATGGSSTSSDVQRYVMATGNFDSPVRRRWSVVSSLTHTTNWDPGRDPYNIETFSASTRGVVHRSIRSDASYQIMLNSDSASVGARYSSAWNYRLEGSPVRTLQLVLSLRGVRSGPALMRPLAVGRGLVTDVNWRPVPTLQVVGQYGVNSSATTTSARSTTRTLTLRYEPTYRWQWWGSYTRSDQNVFVSAAGELSSREVVSTRVQYAPNRHLAVNAAVSYNDPGRENESRRIDLTLAWSFGR